VPVLVSLVDVLESPVLVEPTAVELPTVVVAEVVGVLVVGGPPLPLVDELVARSTSPAGASPA